MIGRTSLVEQKKLQWAKEREEMARLSGSCGPTKFTDPVRTAIRGHYGSTVSLRSLASENSATCATSIQSLDFSGGSLINLQDKTVIPNTMRRRSPSLPPIYNNKNQQQCLIQEYRALGVDGLHYQPRPQQYQHRSIGHHDNQNNSCYPYEEREGETSGYASDSVEANVTSLQDPQMSCKPLEINMDEKTWQNPYYTTDESSLPPSRKLSNIRAGEFNRPRWGSIWGQDPSKGNPPPPSWLERGLSRLDHSSQVLVINHDSASSPDSSTTGSSGSDSNKTYLRGQNLPIDADVLQEREARRQKAVELQKAIKQQLEERERQRREEKEKRIKEEREEEERIKNEREKEKERLEEEQRRQKEKEADKQKKAEAMREVLEAAERLAKEEKKFRRKRDINENNKSTEENVYEPNSKDRLPDQNLSSLQQTNNNYSIDAQIGKETKQVNNQRESDFVKIKEQNDERESSGESKETNSIRVPVSKEVAIVLSGRLEDTELLNKANLQVMNLVMTPSPRKNEVNHIMSGLSVLVNSWGGPGYTTSSRTKVSPRFVENRLLTPSKYRTPNSRECGTQTDSEKEIQDLQDRIQEMEISKNFVKERKDVTNNNRRDVEKSTCTSTAEETTVKILPRTKTQPRKSLETRPRWNANRPGTRYRTQSEKDPHYQRRMRLRRRRVESSDEGSRSPSPDPRKHINSKQKTRSLTRCKAKLDSYDADLSMDSLNSIIPLRFDGNGRINIEDRRNEHGNINKYNESSSYQPNLLKDNVDSKIWCGQEILSHLCSLRNLDDLLKDDKKDANLIPDLSKATCNSQEEFRRLVERCPEYKIKPEKVKKEDVRVRDKDFSWRATKRELKSVGREWAYGDPIPPDMRSLNLQELQQVAIDWRMLTSVRPKLRQDEEMFSRLVEMGKLTAKTSAKENRSYSSPIRRNKNRAGIIESSVKICGECGEEFCTGESCGDILYDSFLRVTVIPRQSKITVSANTAAIIAGMDKSKKKGKKKKKRSKSNGQRKNAKLLVRRKARKSAGNHPETQSKTRQHFEENDKEDEEGGKKKFKRKCSKYSKKGGYLPK